MAIGAAPNSSVQNTSAESPVGSSAILGPSWRQREALRKIEDRSFAGPGFRRVLLYQRGATLPPDSSSVNSDMRTTTAIACGY